MIKFYYTYIITHHFDFNIAKIALNKYKSDLFVPLRLFQTQFLDFCTYEESLKASNLYIEPMSAGVTEEHFRELMTRRINR